MQWLLETGRAGRQDIGYTPSFHDILFGNILFAPPPLCRAVITPCAFLPLFFFNGLSSDFSGFFFVISLKSDAVMALRDGVVGLY